MSEQSSARDFLGRELHSALTMAGLDPQQVPDDLDLLDAQIVDSFGLLELIGKIEANFEVDINFEALDPSDLTRFGGLSQFVDAVLAESDGSTLSSNVAVDLPAIAGTNGADDSNAQAHEPQPSPALASSALPTANRGAMRHVGRGAAGLYRFGSRAWGKLFSLATSPAFAAFGSNSVIQPPVRLSGESRIAVGSRVFVGAGSWLQALPHEGDEVTISIGDDVHIAGLCVLSAISSLRLGQGVGIARGVYIADHSHAFDDPGRPGVEMSLTNIAPVEIADHAWLGENSVILPGVRVGEGSVVSANSVVTRSVPDRTVVAGVPARVVRQTST